MRTPFRWLAIPVVSFLIPTVLAGQNEQSSQKSSNLPPASSPDTDVDFSKLPPISLPDEFPKTKQGKSNSNELPVVVSAPKGAGAPGAQLPGSTNPKALQPNNLRGQSSAGAQKMSLSDNLPPAATPKGTFPATTPTVTSSVLTVQPRQELNQQRNLNNNSLPNNSLPNNSLPNNSLPNNSLPNNSLPNNSLPNNSLPNNSLPNNSLPNNSLPNNSLPNNSLPNNSLTNNALSNQSQSNVFDSRNNNQTIGNQQNNHLNQPNFQNLPRQRNSMADQNSMAGRRSVLQSHPVTADPIPVVGNPKSSVVPATFNQQLQQGNAGQPTGQSNQTSNQTQVSKAAMQLIQQFDPAKIEGSLPGEPVGLINIMQNTAPNSRHSAAQKYWNCFGAWLKLRFAEQVAAGLRQVKLPQTAHEQTMLKTAVAMSESRLQQAKVNLQTAQRALRPYARTQHRDILPLAKDLPLVQSYQTHYNLYAQRRMLPGRARALDRSLPQQKKLLEQNAKLVQQGQQAATQAQQAYAMGQANIASVLEATRLMESANQQFINSIVQYNKSTAEYAFLVASPYQNPKTVAAMLIPSPSFTPQLSTIANQNVVESNLPTGQFGRPTRFNTASVLNSSRIPDSQQIVGRSQAPTQPRVASLPGNMTNRRGNTGQLPPVTSSQTPITGQVNPNQWNQGNRQPIGRSNVPPTAPRQNGQFGGGSGQFGGR